MTTRRTDDVIELLGERIPDPYRWLEDASDPEVQAWMDAQDERARELLGKLPGRDALAKRTAELLYFDAIGCPTRKGERLFYTRKHRDKEKNVVYWRGPEGEETVLFDPNALSEDGSVSLGVWVPSPDGELVAYSLKENNADEATLFVREVATGLDRETDVIPGAKYAHPSWLPDGSGFYYTRLPVDPSIPIAELPGHAEVCYHAIGSRPEADRVVRGRTGSAQTFLHADVSRDGRWLVVYVQHGWTSTDVHLADRELADTDLRPLVEGQEALYEVAVWENTVFILTDEGAPRYRIMAADVKTPGRESWRELVPEDAATLESAGVVGGHLVARYLTDVASELRIFTLGGAPVRSIPLPGLGTVSAMSGREDDAELFYAYESFTEPTRIFRTELPHGDADEWARVDYDFDTKTLVCEQVRYPSRDGTEIPMFILRRRDLEPTGEHPTVLTGYGGFNVSLTPVFAPQALPWLEAGGVYAIPNLRGGGEYGEEWHRAGMLENKQNVFDDFICAAEALIERGWTKPEKLAIRGGSNGGLLVGAAMTQRPELFRAVLCAVPLLDMLRYHLFGSGATWIPEYGTADNEAQARAIRAYSPQQAVKDGTEYPALLMLSADSDDRVDPMHARKFVAAIEHASTSNHPILMRIERNAGHTGADMVARQVDQAADAYAFLGNQLGLRYQ